MVVYFLSDSLVVRECAIYSTEPENTRPEERCLTTDFSGKQTVKPAACPLERIVRRLRACHFHYGPTGL